MQILNRPLRVMHIISGDLWAGAEAQAFTLLSALAPKVELLVIVLNPGELAARLQSIGIRVVILAEAELNSFAIFSHIRRHIRAFSPDILHTHRQKENILGALANWMSSSKPAKSLRTVHGAPEFSPKGKQRVQVFLDGWVGRHLQQAVIAVSEELAAKLIRLFPPATIHIIKNGVDVVALQTVKPLPEFAPSFTHIGIIGRLEQVKRVDIFIEMAALLEKQSHRHPLRFHFIGDGRLKTELQSQADHLGIADRLVFHGHRRDIASCIKSLDAIVMCSDHEGTPMTALEAMALNTPLIAHNVGGLVDVLKDYPSLRVTNHCAQGYADAVEHLLALPAKMPVALADDYSQSSNLARTLELYCRLVSA